MYAQQMFRNLLYKLKEQKDGLKIIKSQYDLLDSNISKEFLLINDDSYALGKLSMSMSINSDQIYIFEEYHWIVMENELRMLKNAKADEWISCQDKMQYGSMVAFRLGICRKADNTPQTGLRISIRKSFKPSLDATLSIMVDEIEYTMSNRTRYNLKQGKSWAPFFFDDNLIDTLSSVSIHLSIYFR